MGVKILNDNDLIKFLFQKVFNLKSRHFFGILAPSCEEVVYIEKLCKFKVEN
jgi:hypothetical protein